MAARTRALLLARYSSSLSPLCGPRGLATAAVTAPVFAAHAVSFSLGCKCHLRKKEKGKEIPPSGCDYKHWLVVVENPPQHFSRHDMIIAINTLSKVFSIEQKMRMKIYSVSMKYYFAFGALVFKELADKLKELSGVRYVLPDSYLDVETKDYRVEPFINGEAVPYSSDYHVLCEAGYRAIGGPHVGVWYPKYRKPIFNQDGSFSCVSINQDDADPKYHGTANKAGPV